MGNGIAIKNTGVSWLENKGSLKTKLAVSGCLCKIQNKTKNSQFSVIPAQAGILVELMQWIVFAYIYECLARFPPARE